ncbi:hypothetical protein AWB71_06083 [Caballeronia peredens]|nr:hypothetical protein AWB71_06083 [Caballeronia peredens]
MESLRQSGRLRAKLAVGPADDAYEREADTLADRVMRMPAPAVRRQCAACARDDHDDPTVRLMPAGVPATGSADAAAAGLGRGAALPATERTFFEPRLGRDLGDVRIHAESSAATMLGARAFALGRDIAFAPGEWSPGTSTARGLLAHELVHVLQAGRGAPAALRRDSGDSRKPSPPAPAPQGPPVVGGVCGPDVTAETARIWAQVRSDFLGWSGKDKLRACQYLVQPFVKGGSGAGTGYGLNADAFDTIGLYQGSVHYLREPPYHPPCGIPGSPTPAPAPGTDCDADPTAPGCDFDPGHETGCSNTVKVGPECWLSGSVNYGTYGVMMRACYDVMPFPFDKAFSLAATKLLAGGYKLYKGDDPRAPLAWAAATWTGGPGATATGSNRSGCAPTCPVPYSGTPFDYVWEPVKPR